MNRKTLFFILVASIYSYQLTYTGKRSTQTKTIQLNEYDTNIVNFIKKFIDKSLIITTSFSDDTKLMTISYNFDKQKFIKDVINKQKIDTKFFNDIPYLILKEDYYSFLNIAFDNLSKNTDYDKKLEKIITCILKKLEENDFDILNDKRIMSFLFSACKAGSIATIKAFVEYNQDYLFNEYSITRINIYGTYKEKIYSSLLEKTINNFNIKKTKNFLSILEYLLKQHILLDHEKNEQHILKIIQRLSKNIYSSSNLIFFLQKVVTCSNEQLIFNIITNLVYRVDCDDSPIACMMLENLINEKNEISEDFLYTTFKDKSGLAHLAAKDNNVSILNYLIEQKIDFTSVNNFKKTPLMLVSDKNCAQIICNKLIELGNIEEIFNAILYHLEYRKNIALYLIEALISNKLFNKNELLNKKNELKKIIKDNKNFIDSGLLKEAFELSKFTTKLFIKNAEPKMLKKYYNSFVEKYNSSIGFNNMTKKGNYFSLPKDLFYKFKLLLEKLSPDTNSEEYTKLFFQAFRYKHCEIIKAFLVSNKNFFYIIDKRGNTPLHLAACYDCCKTLKYLLKNEADYTIINQNGKTPLALANSSKCIRYLCNTMKEHGNEELLLQTLHSNTDNPSLVVEIIRTLKDYCTRTDHYKDEKGTLFLDKIIKNCCNNWSNYIFYLIKTGIDPSLINSTKTNSKNNIQFVFRSYSMLINDMVSKIKRGDDPFVVYLKASKYCEALGSNTKTNIRHYANKSVRKKYDKLLILYQNLKTTIKTLTDEEKTINKESSKNIFRTLKIIKYTFLKFHTINQYQLRLIEKKLNNKNNKFIEFVNQYFPDFPDSSVEFEYDNNQNYCNNESPLILNEFNEFKENVLDYVKNTTNEYFPLNRVPKNIVNHQLNCLKISISKAF